MKGKSKKEAGDSGDEVSGQAEETPIDEATIDYLQMVTSLIEGRDVSRDEILALLRKELRQHSIGKEKKQHYPDKRPRGDPK